MRAWVSLSLGLAMGLAVLAGTQAAWADGTNMIGRQSQNEGMLIVPAPGKVAVDGDLKDWDWSGRIWVFADTAVRDRYSVEAAGMWDKDNLYLAAKWKAPLPMFSLIDPAFNPDEGWKEDSWQMRMATADRTLWITTWYFTPRKQPVMHIAYWKEAARYTETEPGVLLPAPPGGAELGQGAEMAYKMDADGKGFVQEIKIPWKLLFKTVPEIKAGLTIRLGNEFLWSDPTGKTYPAHRYADNMQPGKTSREFYWTAKDSWGDARLVEKGNVPLREYRSATSKIQGTVPVRLEIPGDAARFTVVIEHGGGRRVRTLAADGDPADYRVKGKAGEGTQGVEVLWDCLDDQGRLVAPGTYRVRGLTHKGLSAAYEMCFYNPGTPPWQTKDGRGGWGADHSGPIAVAAGGDWTVVTFPVVEGGCGILGIDATGQKRWGDRRGVTKVAADAQYAYAYVTAWYTGETLCRFGLKDGAMAPFVLDGKPRTFDLPLKEILGRDDPGKITGLAVSGGQLVLALSTGRLAVLDAASAAVRKQFDVPSPGEIAFSRDGKLYGLVDGRACRLDLETGAATPIATPGLGQGAALAVDGDGNLVIADVGPDSQVKAYSAEGKAVYACGKKGGRPIRGAFDEQAMVKMSSVAVDAAGRVWAVENWPYPRRVSVWGRDGKLVRDYVGNANYAGGGCGLHDQDPTLATCGPIEMKLDKAAGSWKVTRILWVPDESRGESFRIQTDAQVQRFTSRLSGKPHEYMYTHDFVLDGGTGNVVYMEREGRWQPVAAVCLVGHVSGRYDHDWRTLEDPSGEMAGLNPFDTVLWNDRNGDGKVQRNECVIVSAAKPGDAKGRGEPALSIRNGWGARLGDDFSIYVSGVLRYRPTGFAPDGAPIYGLDGLDQTGFLDKGEVDPVPVPGENELVCLTWGWDRRPKLAGIDLETRTVQWTYPNPYPGVHGSHDATMPKPGLLIGPLKTCGTATVNDAVGTVFLMRGNQGQDFLMTSDGLYVGAIFQDCRLPAESLPDAEAPLRSMPLEGLSEGGEPFNGWFGKQADGVIRLTTGMAREACMILQIKGLETVRRHMGGAVAVDAVAIARADADSAARAKKPAQPKRYVVKRLAKAPAIDDGPADWGDVPGLAIAREGAPDSAGVKLAYDDSNLYVMFDVRDSSPWRNEGKDYRRLFKTGDAVDLQIGLDAKPHRDPVAGDQRLVFGQVNGKPVVVRMAPVDKTAPAALNAKYTSPVGTRAFDRVEVLADAQVAVRVEGGRYRVKAAVPLATLGIAPKPGLALRGDAGFISSDAQGLIDIARTYWANPTTNLVNDLPSEAWLYPETWGELVLE